MRSRFSVQLMLGEGEQGTAAGQSSPWAVGVPPTGCLAQSRGPALSGPSTASVGRGSPLILILLCIFLLDPHWDFQYTTWNRHNSVPFSCRVQMSMHIYMCTF